MKSACALTIMLVLAAMSHGARGIADGDVRDTHSGADLVVYNGRIYTVDARNMVAEAMAVRGDRILMVGATDELLGAYPDAERLNLAGKAVVPGLIDAHAHLMGRGIALLEADLVGTSSVKDILARLRMFEAKLPEGAWLTGRGWDQNDWPNQEYPSRSDLDAIFPNRPVWLTRIDGHAAWANTAALRAADFEAIRAAADPEGGHIVRDEGGEPTGIFIDTAMRFVGSRIPGSTPEQRREALRRVVEETARYGLTGVHDAGIDLNDIELYRAAIDEGLFPLRLYGMISGTGRTFEQLCDEGPILDYGGRLTVRSVKLYMDGALGSRGAALLAPYADDPSSTGLLRTSPEQFGQHVVDAMRCGFQVNTHAIGDRANRVVLDAYEAAQLVLGRTTGRHRIEHAQIVDPDDISRFRRLGVIASMQPTHATSDMYWAEDRLGTERIDGAYAWRSFLDADVPLAFGSDFPVEGVNPLVGFYAAVTRQDVDGYPEGGWLSHQRMTRAEALRAFTIDAAYAAFQEDELGSLEPGKLADFVILTQDIMAVPSDEILQTRVWATYLGGEPIYVSEPSSDTR